MNLSVSQIRSHLEKEGMDFTNELKRNLTKHDWVVYCKPPFGGKQGVVRYLSRYTHKTAITHHRIKSYDIAEVTFTYKDYRHGNVERVMRLRGKEFIRRLSMHILPKGFCRIRHYGILSGRWSSRLGNVNLTTSTITWVEYWQTRGLDINQCPYCKKGKLQLVGEIKPVRGPPYDHYSNTKTHNN